MLLYLKCRHCDAEHRFRNYSPTRIEFKMHEGEMYKTTCTQCKNVIYTEVNDIYARESKVVTIVVSVITLIALVFSLLVITGYFIIGPTIGMYTAIGLPIVPGIAYSLYKRDERRRVNAFNRHKV